MNSERGFTLIELLVTLTVLIVLLAIGVPNLSRLVVDNKVFAASTSLTASLTLARNEAIRRNKPVYVTGLASATNAQFSSGWEVWVDLDGSGAKSSSDPVIRVQEALPAGMRAGGVQSIGFNNRGTAINAASSTLTTCPTSNGATTGFALDVLPTGFVESRKITSC